MLHTWTWAGVLVPIRSLIAFQRPLEAVSDGDWIELNWAYKCIWSKRSWKERNIVTSSILSTLIKRIKKDLVLSSCPCNPWKCEIKEGGSDQKGKMRWAWKVRNRNGSNGIVIYWTIEHSYKHITEEEDRGEQIVAGIHVNLFISFGSDDKSIRNVVNMKE